MIGNGNWLRDIKLPNDKALEKYDKLPLSILSDITLAPSSNLRLLILKNM